MGTLMRSFVDVITFSKAPNISREKVSKKQSASLLLKLPLHTYIIRISINFKLNFFMTLKSIKISPQIFLFIREISIIPFYKIKKA
jgi:hypothetical protein